MRLLGRIGTEAAPPVTPVEGTEFCTDEVGLGHGSCGTGDANVRATNPFRPGFAEPPSVLVGRDDVLERVDKALAAAAFDGYTPRPIIIVGPQGMGKTVLLDEVARRAGAVHGWPTLMTEVTGPGRLVQTLSAHAVSAERLLAHVPSRSRYQVERVVLRTRVGPVGSDVHFTRQPPETSALAMEGAFDSLAAAAIEGRSGFVLAIDELQLTSNDDFAQLAALIQHGTLQSWPMVVVCAALPSFRCGLTPDGTERSLRYMERVEWYQLGPLSGPATVAALQGTAAQGGRPMDDDAAQLLARAAGGYPYAMQVYGKHAWQAALDQDRVNLAAARAALKPAGAEFDGAFYANAWAVATQRERDYLRSLAELSRTGWPVTSAAVARQLAFSHAVDQSRARLVSRGTILSCGDVVNFAIPGMAAYVLRQPTGLTVSRVRAVQASPAANYPVHLMRARGRQRTQLER